LPSNKNRITGTSCWNSISGQLFTNRYKTRKAGETPANRNETTLELMSIDHERVVICRVYLSANWYSVGSRIASMEENNDGLSRCLVSLLGLLTTIFDRYLNLLASG